MPELTVKPDDSGIRTDVFVAQNYPEFTRATLAKLFDGTHVLVNGQDFKHGYKLRPGDKVQVDIGPLNAPVKVVDLPIIYEDDSVVVMDKPAGMLTHSKGSFNDEPTVASFLATKITDDTLIGNRAGIVHRLDRATSGVIIGAKTHSAQTWLQKQFSKRNVKKTYLAVAEGVPNPEAALIDAPIARNPKKPQTFMVSATGKPAKTQYKVLKNVTHNGEVASLLELKPETGRTHQIRVHLAYINHPIIGDNLYGHGEQHMLLHASELELTLPAGKRQIFKAPLPNTLKRFV